MAGFDINSLLLFEPATYQCVKCYALFRALPLRFLELTKNEKPLKCPVCSVEYIPTKNYGRTQWDAFLKRKNPLGIENITQHARGLAYIASCYKDQSDFFPTPPLGALLKVLSMAQKFVHFTTYGIHPLFIGAFKVIGQRIPVRGIISGAKGEFLSEATVSEITNYLDEAPGMLLNLYDPSKSGWKDTPHQKLVIIDGLVAFKGSANLTVSAWRKAAEGREVVEVVTNIDDVLNLNNRYFSPVWAEFSDITTTVEMSW